MDSRDVELRIQKISTLIGDLHEELIQDDEVAWLALPVTRVELEPNIKEIRAHIQIGKCNW